VTARNWAGNVIFGAQRLHRPTTVEQLQEAVTGAARVRALGTGHSFNRIADTAGDLISVADLDLPTELDPDARTVRVAGGKRFGELAVELDAQGWALPNLGSLPHISIAGACATGTHGSGDANRCLAAGVVALEFVRGDGELVRIGRDDPGFGGSVVALGALGITTTMTLEVVPSFTVRQDVWLENPIEQVLDRLPAIMAGGYSVSLFTTWQRRDIIDMVWVKSRADGSPVADGRDWGAVAADAPQHPIFGTEASAATEQLGVAGPWHARLPHFRAEFTPSVGEEQQSEFLLPREHGAAAIAALRELPLQSALQICEVRTVAADELWLSPCGGRDTIALHFTWVDDDALVQPLVAAIEAALAPFDARPHWGKVFTMDPATVRGHYPRLPDFADLAAHFDPERRFGNDYLDAFVYR
jgi:xylitol oxidase